MAIKWKNNKYKGILTVLLCMALTGVMMCNLYPVFRKNAENTIQESEKAWQEQETASKEQSVFTVDDEFERYLLSSIYYLNYEITPNMDAYAYLTQNYDTNKLTSDEQAGIKEAASRLMKNMRNQYVIGPGYLSLCQLCKRCGEKRLEVILCWPRPSMTLTTIFMMIMMPVW